MYFIDIEDYSEEFTINHFESFIEINDIVGENQARSGSYLFVPEVDFTYFEIDTD